MQEAVTQKCVAAFFRPFFALPRKRWGVLTDAQRARTEVVIVLWHKCRCGTLIPQGIKQCPSCATGSGGQISRHMEYNAHRRDKKAAAFYVCNEWRKTRAYALSLYDGLDMYAFYAQHRIETADMVHHIVEIEEDWTKRLDIGNLFPLSNKNHGIISALYKRDEMTKKQTQEKLREIIKMHWEREGGIEKVLKVHR